MTRLQEEKGRFSFVKSISEWTANTVTSLYNKVTALLEGMISNLDWGTGVRKYTRQKGLLVNNEHISGLPDSNDDSDDAKEFRRRLAESLGQDQQSTQTEIQSERTAVESASPSEGSSQRRRRTKTKGIQQVNPPEN